MSTQKTNFDFDDIACRYDRFNHLFSFGIDRKWRKTVVKTLNCKPHQRVLDLCCGTGDLVFSFLKHSPIRHVTGLDLSEPMIHLAQEKQIRYHGKPWMHDKTIQWHAADATCTGLPSDSFDLITCAFGIRNITHRAVALREMRRLLKPSGTLCILEFSLPYVPLLRWSYTLYLSHIMPAAGRLVIGSHDSVKYLAQSIRHWHTQVDFSAELKHEGFALYRKNPLTAGIATCWLAKKK